MNTAHRRGFASLLVVMTLPFFAAALLALAMFTATDARRTTAAVQNVQARQLLLAGGMALLERSADWPETPDLQAFDVPLPPSLVDGNTSVHVAVSMEGRSVTGRVTTHYEGHTSSQIIRMNRMDGRWKVGAVVLGEN